MKYLCQTVWRLVGPDKLAPERKFTYLDISAHTAILIERHF